MVSIKKSIVEDDFIHVRFRPPSQFTRIRTPDRAKRIAQDESKGAKVRLGRTNAGSWLTQSVLIRRGHGKTERDARSIAKRIQKRVDD